MTMDVETGGMHRISIRLTCIADPSQRAWLTMHVRPRDDGQVRARLELDDILANPLALSQAEKTIIKTEIMGGVLTARRFAKRGCSIDLLAIGGDKEGDQRLNGIASIAFAVAANLAVLQGLKVHDLRTEPRGGYGWALESVEVSADD